MQELSSHVEQPSTRVLLVDGREDFTEAVERFLRRQPDLEILRVLGPGEDPLAQAESQRPCVALVDLEAPTLDSLALIAQLRLALPGLGIVALSLCEDSAHLQATLRAGADALVNKARLVQELMPAIRRAGHHGWPGPSVSLTNPGT